MLVPHRVSLVTRAHTRCYTYTEGGGGGGGGGHGMCRNAPIESQCVWLRLFGFGPHTAIARTPFESTYSILTSGPRPPGLLSTAFGSNPG